MLCRICGDKPAVVHLNHKNKEGEIEECYLCSSCFRKKGFSMDKLAPDFLQNFFESHHFSKQNDSVQPEKVEYDSCPVCQCSKMDIVKKGRVGCAECFHTFEKDLPQLLKKMQGDTLHKGSMPKNQTNVSENSKIEELTRKLKKAIKQENYEEAAVLRDKIKEMKKK